MMLPMLLIVLLIVTRVARAAGPADWMGSLLPTIGQLPLTNITLPGTHDSGAYNLTNKNNGDFNDYLASQYGTAQSLTVAQQAITGVRYFDVRAGYDTNKAQWRFHHGNYATAIQPALVDLAAFLAAHPSEIVIVEVSHFIDPSVPTNPTDSQIVALLTNITSIFGSMLVPRTVSINTTSIGTLLAGNHRALVTVERCDLLTSFPSLWCGTALINSYANSDDVNAMIAYNNQQVTSFVASKNVYYTNSQLFKLSWILTPNAANAQSNPFGYPSSLRVMAQAANNHWSSWVNGTRAQYSGSVITNIVLFDFPEQITDWLVSIQPGFAAALPTSSSSSLSSVSSSSSVVVSVASSSSGLSHTVNGATALSAAALLLPLTVVIVGLLVG